MSTRRPYTPNREVLFGPQTINLLSGSNGDNVVIARLNDQDTRFLVTNIILENVYQKGAGARAVQPQVTATNGANNISATFTYSAANDDVGFFNQLALVSNPVPVITGVDTTVVIPQPEALIIDKTVVGEGQVTATKARTNGVATIVTGAAHGFATGDLITITGFTDTTFNAVDACVTVVNTTTFTYENAGPDVASGADVTGNVGALKVNAYAIGIYW